MKKSVEILKFTALFVVILFTGCANTTSDFTSDTSTVSENLNESSADTIEVSENVAETNDESPALLELSGNPDDVVQTEDNAYIVGDKCVIFIEKGCKIPGNFLVAVEDVITELENQTGTKFNNDSIYNEVHCGEILEYYYGPDYWNGYYGDSDKVYIVLINEDEHKDAIPCAMSRTALFVDPYIQVNEQGIGVVGHELLHSLMWCNHEHYESKITEGLASYWQVNLVQYLPEYAVSYYDKDESYFGFHDGEINAQTAETLYLTEYDRTDGNQPYEYGFGLITYLYETYSVDGVNDFLTYLDTKLMEERRKQGEEDWTDEELYNNIYDVDSLEFEVNILKEYYGEDFFTEFGTWYSDNESRFY